VTARISLIPEETRGHTPRLQLRDFDFMCKAGRGISMPSLNRDGWKS